MRLKDYRLQIKFKNCLPRVKVINQKKLESGFDYNHDGLAVRGKSVDFLKDARFLDAYRLGMDSGHKIGRAKGSNSDIHLEWRVLVCCWAGMHARKLEGDFVECGVNTGTLSLAVCRYIDFNATGKRFFLFDTYQGIPEKQITVEDREMVSFMNNEFYEECFEVAKKNFSVFPRATLVRGCVPDTLTSVKIEKVCYLSIDMNLVVPEIAAIEYFWNKLVPGAVVVLDDYGFANHHQQKDAFDQFAKKNGVEILLVPTGQGLLLKA